MTPRLTGRGCTSTDADPLCTGVTCGSPLAGTEEVVEVVMFKAAERLGVEAIFDRLCRPFSRRGLACLQECQRNDPAVDAAELAPLVTEGLGRPYDWVIGQRDHYLPVGVGGHEGELDLRHAPLVTGADDFIWYGRMAPSGGLERRTDRVVVGAPGRDVDVVVLPRHATDPEVNGPPAEEPVVDPLLVERSAEARDRCELLLSPRSCYPLAHSPQPSDNTAGASLPQEVVVANSAKPARRRARHGDDP